MVVEVEEEAIKSRFSVLAAAHQLCLCPVSKLQQLLLLNCDAGQGKAAAELVYL